MILDSAAFFADFSVAVTLPSAAVVRGIFDAAYADPLGMAGNQPILTVASADVSAVAVGAALTINAVGYTVTEIQPDGTGMTTLMLRRA